MSEERSSGLMTYIDEKKLKAEISIDVVNLDSAMMTHAGLELHYASQSANARAQYERVKGMVEILEAKLDAEIRERLTEEAATAGSKKSPTEASIKAAILVDRRYVSARSRLIEAQHIWKLCEAAENSFHSRKDMILEIARDRRKERDGELRVLEEKKENLMKILAERKSAV